MLLPGAGDGKAGPGRSMPDGFDAGWAILGCSPMPACTVLPHCMATNVGRALFLLRRTSPDAGVHRCSFVFCSFKRGGSSVHARAPFAG